MNFIFCWLCSTVLSKRGHTKCTPLKHIIWYINVTIFQMSHHDVQALNIQISCFVILGCFVHIFGHFLIGRSSKRCLGSLRIRKRYRQIGFLFIFEIEIQLNKCETGPYFLQNFQCTTMFISSYCKICELNTERESVFAADVSGVSLKVSCKIF